MSLKESYLFLTALKQRFQRSLLGFMLGQQWQLCLGNTEDIKCWMISEESFTKAGKQSVPALHCDLKSHQPSSTPTKKKPSDNSKTFYTRKCHVMQCERPEHRCRVLAAPAVCEAFMFSNQAALANACWHCAGMIWKHTFDHKNQFINSDDASSTCHKRYPRMPGSIWRWDAGLDDGGVPGGQRGETIFAADAAAAGTAKQMVHTRCLWLA